MKRITRNTGCGDYGLENELDLTTKFDLFNKAGVCEDLMERVGVESPFKLKLALTEEQILKIKGCYESNAEELQNLEDYIEENGTTDDGISDASCSFEQGYNNALEFVMRLLGI